MQRFLNELKRRNVFRVAAAYALIAWIMAQGATMLFPAFGAPDWVLQVLFSVLLGGFPLALLLAWAFELTAQGIRRTQTQAENAVVGRGGWALDALFILGLSMAVVVLVLGRGPLELVGMVSTGPARNSPSEALAAEPVEMVVLPFVSSSAAPENRFLASGFSEALREQLAGVPGLNVTGRESAQRYLAVKGAGERSGRSPAVGFALEGSLRRHGDRIEAALHLIRLDDGSEVWAGKHEVAVQQVFELQRELRNALVQALGLDGSGWALPPGEGIQEPEAYLSYLRGLGRFRSGAGDDLYRAEELFLQALDRSPDSGVLHAVLGATYLAQAPQPRHASPRQLLDEARSHLDKAAGLATDSPRIAGWQSAVLHALARQSGNIDDYRRAEQRFRDALKNWPDDGELQVGLGELCLDWGRYDCAREMAERSMDIDPLALAPRILLVRAFTGMGAFDRASAEFARLEQLDASSAAALAAGGQLALATGRVEDAIAIYTRAVELDPALAWQLLPAAATVEAHGSVELALAYLAKRDDGAMWSGTVKRALAQDYAGAWERIAGRVENPAVETAATLIRLATQAGHLEQAAALVDQHFGQWISARGPLVGELARSVAPDVAYVLAQTGRDGQAQRILDRHLAGLIAIEGQAGTAEVELARAINLAQQQRIEAGFAALQRAEKLGFRSLWGGVGPLVYLPDYAPLRALEQHDEYAKLLAGIAARAIHPSVASL